jgi:hypothetical protein
LVVIPVQALMVTASKVVRTSIIVMGIQALAQEEEKKEG